MLTKPVFKIEKYDVANLEANLTKIKAHYCGSVYDLTTVTHNINMSIYENKVEEVENVFDDFKADIAYYISDFKIKYNSTTGAINYILNELLDYIWKDFYSLKVTYLRNLSERIK